MTCTHVFLYLSTEFVTIHIRHHDVRNNHIRDNLQRHLQSFLPISSLPYIEIIGKHIGNISSDVRIILNDKQDFAPVMLCNLFRFNVRKRRFLHFTMQSIRINFIFLKTHDKRRTFLNFTIHMDLCFMQGHKVLHQSQSYARS